MMTMEGKFQTQVFTNSKLILIKLLLHIMIKGSFLLRVFTLRVV